MQQPKALVNNAISTDDPFLTMLATTALPDLPSATHAEVLAVRNQAQENLDVSTLFYWPLARTDYWLGNDSAALESLRLFSANESGSAEVRELWLAVEHDAASKQIHGDPIVTLPKGPAIAYLISTDFKQFARIKLPNRTSPITAALQSTVPVSWHLVAITPLLIGAKRGTYGAWSIPKKKFRTSATANLAEGTTH